MLTAYMCVRIFNDEFGYVYKAFEAPYRIAFESPDVQYLKAAFKDSPKIRTKSSIKGHIIGNGGDGTDWFSTGKTDNGWMEIVSCDGRQGYVKKDAVTTESYISPSIREFEYKSQVRNHKIVLAWDAIYDLKDNDSIPARLENVKMPMSSPLHGTKLRITQENWNPWQTSVMLRMYTILDMKYGRL